MSPTTAEERDHAGDRELLARAAGGDRTAFGVLYDRHVRAVYWQAYAVLHDGDQAQDVAQDAFITTWQRIGKITLVDESVLPWLLTTARFTALNARRRAQRDHRHGTQLDPGMRHGGPSVEDEVEAGQIRVEIDKAVAGLSPTDQRLYDLCVAGDHTYESAARELGVSHATVRNRLSRLRTRLRTDLRAMRETS